MGNLLGTALQGGALFATGGASGLADGLFGGAVGAGSPNTASTTTFAPTNTTFGSVNFKSAGAGDRGKATGMGGSHAPGGRRHL